MKCFVYGNNLDEDRACKSQGIVAFAVPDIGLMFKGRFIGTQSECEYMSLLTFLRFVEQNPKVFSTAKLDILSDAAAMVFQIVGKVPETVLAGRYLPAVRHFQDKISFSLHWIPPQDNSAFEGILDLPPLKAAPPIDTHFADPPRRKSKAANPPRRRNPGF